MSIVLHASCISDKGDAELCCIGQSDTLVSGVINDYVHAQKSAM